MIRQSKVSKATQTPKIALPGEWLFYFIAIAGALISLLLWYASVLQSNANLSHTIRIQTQNVANAIEVQFELRIAALKHMAKHLEQGNESLFIRWQNNVVEFVNDYGGFTAIGLTDLDLKPTWISPNNSDTQKLYATFLKDNSKEVENLRNDHQVWVSPAIPLDDGNMGVFIVVPVIINNELKAYLISIVNTSEALNLDVNHDDYAVTIYDDTHKIYQNLVNTPNSEIKPQVAGINMYGATWEVYVQPTSHLVSVLRTGLPAVALILGICIAVLFAITTRLAQLARQRARSLDQMNRDLKIEITERMAAEASKQKLEKALLQGQKLQAIGTLAGGIAHDFNNLLYAIIGYVEMGREDLKENTLLYNNLGKVLEASRRGQELISRILAFSRRQHLEFKPIPVKSTIENVLALLEPTIPASVRIDFINDVPEQFMIMGDQTRLHQVIVNIINNAVDAMDEEGTAVIHVSVVSPDHELLQQFPDVSPSNYCKIEITDTGHGMDQSTVERIFEPFFTTKEVGKGTGLGLATVHTIVKEHRGEILVHSQLGQGTTFTILIPEYKP
jgi:signal transduction histidine kinase